MQLITYFVIVFLIGFLASFVYSILFPPQFKDAQDVVRRAVGIPTELRDPPIPNQ